MIAAVSACFDCAHSGKNSYIKKIEKKIKVRYNTRRLLHTTCADRMRIVGAMRNLSLPIKI